jgi:hypothetical protein
MTAPTSLVWDLAGRPGPAKPLEDVPGWCAISGEWCERTADVTKSLGSNFTDRRCFARDDSTRVGPGALWALTGRGLQTLRMWTIIAGADSGPSHEKAWLGSRPGLTLLNRANPMPVHRLLSDPPETEWLLSVAVSGQKHVLPYAQVNSGRSWTVRMETTDITATSDQWAHVHTHTLALRRLGVPADAIPQREPRYIKTSEALAQWREHDLALTGWHTSPLLDLALWTITKETMQ